MSTIFFKPVSDYQRHFDIKEKANELAALYLHKQTNKPYEECLNFVTKETQNLTPRTINVLKKNSVGDRVKAKLDFNQLFTELQQRKLILSPNMVVYENPTVEQSCTALYIENNLARRKKVKHQGFEYEQLGQKDQALFCSNEEFAIKIKNNSISGAHSSPHNSLYNKSAHSSLTSTCRIMVSYSNANTEKFLLGNRHYHSKEVVLENILSLIKNTDLKSLEQLINRYNLYLPTIEDTFNVIKKSTRYYFNLDQAFHEINNLLHHLSSIELAAIVYVGDLYHLAHFNKTFVKDFLDEALLATTYDDVQDVEAIIKTADSDLIALASIMCANLLRGTTLSKLKSDNYEGYIHYAKTIAHIQRFLIKYRQLFDTLYLSPNAPSSLFVFPFSIRNSVVGSDTDSTMFTIQYWVHWYYGEYLFSDHATTLTSFLCYLNSQIVRHLIAMASKQMGVIDEKNATLQMKSEYMFAAYLRANIAKHYGTLTTAREGNILPDPKTDIKGVGLLSSKLPKLITKGIKAEFTQLTTAITQNKKISAHSLMQKIANLEHYIVQKYQEGDTSFFSSENIKEAEAYKDPLKSQYYHYELWQSVFKERYGEIGLPPYKGIKITTRLTNYKAIINWLADDPDMQNRFIEWSKRTNKTYLETLVLPSELFQKDLPERFIRCIDYRANIAQLLRGYYVLLEILGIYIKNKHNTILLMDDINYRPEYGYPGNLI